MKDKDLKRRLDELRCQVQDYTVDHTVRHGTIWGAIHKLERKPAKDYSEIAEQVRAVTNTVELRNQQRMESHTKLARRVKKLEECKPDAELADKVTDAWSAIENLRWRENESYDAVRGQVGEALAGASRLEKKIKQLEGDLAQGREQKNNKLARLTKATKLEAGLRRENDDVLAQRIGKLEEQTEATNETIVHIQNDRSVVWEAVERIRKHVQPDPERVPLQDQIDVVDKRIAKLGDHNVGAINSLAKRVKNLEGRDNTLPERIEKLEKHKASTELYTATTDDLKAPWKAIREARELGISWHDTTMSQVRASQARIRKVENECVELRAELGIAREDDPHIVATPRSGQPIHNRAQLDKLSTFLLDEISGPAPQGERTGDAAIRLLKKYREALHLIEREVAFPKKTDVPYIRWLAQNALGNKNV